MGWQWLICVELGTSVAHAARAPRLACLHLPNDVHSTTLLAVGPSAAHPPCLPQVGRHLSLAQIVPLRAVCKDWRDTLTLATPSGELDLEPGSPTGTGQQQAGADTAASAKRASFYKLCPGLDALTYHVSPRVCASKVRPIVLQPW